jgi:hypothetical protein
VPGITLVVTARVVVGFWRNGAALTSWHGASFVEAFGLADMLGAGSTVVGYYLAYVIGVWHRVRP